MWATEPWRALPRKTEKAPSPKPKPKQRGLAVQLSASSWETDGWIDTPHNPTECDSCMDWVKRLRWVNR